MFIIIGGDGKEYGPVTAEQIRAWIAAGRANLDTKAKAVGTEEWRRVGDFAEFTSPGGPPPLTGVAPTAAGETQLADAGTRLMARLIDWVIEIAVSIPGLIILGTELMRILPMVAQGRTPELSQLNLPRIILGACVIAVCTLGLLVVQVWLLTTRGQSIGKRVMSVRIVLATDGGKPGIVHAWLLRELVITCIGVVLGLIPFIGPLMLRPIFHLVDWCFIFRADRRCVHDLIANTRVLKA
jgi:uncharacterized RDD family membrane protein YckC